MKHIIQNQIRSTGDSYVVTIPSYLIKKGILKEGDVVESIELSTEYQK